MVDAIRACFDSYASGTCCTCGADGTCRARPGTDGGRCFGSVGNTGRRQSFEPFARMVVLVFVILRRVLRTARAIVNGKLRRLGFRFGFRLGFRFPGNLVVCQSLHGYR